jgi:hypothetical protein
MEAIDACFSIVLIEPSRAFKDVVGARPESLLVLSLSSNPLVGLRNAGWISVGGVSGGATVTGIGGFAASASSYRKAMRPASGRRGGGVALNFVGLPGAIFLALSMPQPKPRNREMLDGVGLRDGVLRPQCCSNAADLR